ncbi:hypothetical protein Poli38472_011173 [Pythium oligandrum]|uniref:FAR1 domain-containing protein n=1 Tax=Pythium oligandrum TaxID=41045 RepID=A0A8K1CSL2_PYTOL|nr:hypothetical protein Poli38472_011173 [Pythium oligandrum]|eukprot:TMW67553.1 hypothetical protein Poli38472_011173 [Pythium oligandrum]
MPRRKREGDGKDDQADAVERSEGVQVVDTEDIHVVEVCGEAPPPEQRRFESWSELETYVKEYMTQTNQVYRIRSSVSVAAHNASALRKAETREAEYQAKVAQALAAGRAPPLKRRTRPHAGVISDDCTEERYNRVWVCTHAGTFKPRGTGVRPRTKVRPKGCPASISACLKKEGDTYVVMLTELHLRHNHSISPSQFSAYSNNRLVLTDEQLNHINELRTNGYTAKEILDYIRDTSASRPTMYDVHNLITKLRKQGETARGGELKDTTSLERT